MCVLLLLLTPVTRPPATLGQRLSASLAFRTYYYATPHPHAATNSPDAFPPSATSVMGPPAARPERATSTASFATLAAAGPTLAHSPTPHPSAALPPFGPGAPSHHGPPSSLTAATSSAAESTVFQPVMPVLSPEVPPAAAGATALAAADTARPSSPQCRSPTFATSSDLSIAPHDSISQVGSPDAPPPADRSLPPPLDDVPMPDMSGRSLRRPPPFRQVGTMYGAALWALSRGERYSGSARITP